MREPIFSVEGKKTEGAPILTGWMREVLQVDRRGSSQTRSSRSTWRACAVPARGRVGPGANRPAPTWAKERLIDLLVVTPRWATLEFDMPIPQWRQLLGKSKVTLAGGLRSVTSRVRVGRHRSLPPSSQQGLPSPFSREVRTRFTFSTISSPIIWDGPGTSIRKRSGPWLRWIPC